MTLTFGQGQSIYWKLDIIIFENISDIIQSRVMILGQKAACVEIFKIMWHLVTLTKVKVTVFTWKLKISIFDNFEQSLRHYFFKI